MKSEGKQKITLFNQTSVEADVWTWKFGIEKKTVFTTGDNTLVRWTVEAGGNNFTNGEGALERSV